MINNEPKSYIYLYLIIVHTFLLISFVKHLLLSICILEYSWNNKYFKVCFVPLLMAKSVPLRCKHLHIYFFIDWFWASVIVVIGQKMDWILITVCINKIEHNTIFLFFAFRSRMNRILKVRYYLAKLYLYIKKYHFVWEVPIGLSIQKEQRHEVNFSVLNRE